MNTHFGMAGPESSRRCCHSCPRAVAARGRVERVRFTLVAIIDVAKFDPAPLDAVIVVKSLVEALLIFELVRDVPVGAGDSLPDAHVRARSPRDSPNADRHGAVELLVPRSGTHLH